MRNLTVKGHNIDEQRRRLIVNSVLDEMRRRNVFTEDRVRIWLLNQTDFETSGGLVLTYGEALHYYNEITK